VVFSSSTANETKFIISGVVILVVMSSNYTEGNGLGSRFALRFTHSRNDTVFPPTRTLSPSTLLTGEGSIVGSFPENNAQNYSNNVNHFMLLSRPSGRNLNIKEVFVDIEPQKDYSLFFYIQDDAEKTWFKYFTG